MREIKFRGKSLDENIWIYGFFIGNYNPSVKENVIEDAFIYRGLRNLEYAIAVKPESVSQFTGLKDKNGVEIYEGDILDWHNQTDEPNLEPLAVIWEDGCFCVGNTMIGDIDLDSHIVIGNIYEHPHLLK